MEIALKYIKECDKDSDCIKEKLYKVKNYQGVSGILSIDSDGGAIKNMVLKTILKDKFVKVN